MSKFQEDNRAYKFEEIKYIAEYLKQQYDFFKHMTTINTGAILIVVALSKYMFEGSILKWFLVLPIASLFISLVYSVKLMRLFVTKGVRNIWSWYHFYYENSVKKEKEDFSNEVEKYNKCMSLCLIIGIAMFIVLSGLSYFIKG